MADLLEDDALGGVGGVLCEEPALRAGIARGVVVGGAGHAPPPHAPQRLAHHPRGSPALQECVQIKSEKRWDVLKRSTAQHYYLKLLVTI